MAMKINKLFMILLALNIAAVFIYTLTYSSANLKSTSTNFLVRNLPFETLKTPFTRGTNPFAKLGAYPQPDVQVPYKNKLETTKYDKITYGLFNDDDYCEKVDYYNLRNPDNIFKKQHFFSDYARDTIIRLNVIKKVGTNLMPYFSKNSQNSDLTEVRNLHLDPRINFFVTQLDNFYRYHEIGKHFLCATQVYNHIPGHGALIRKDDLVESVALYAEKYTDKPQCFNKQMFFPAAYRLYNKEECQAFFERIHSADYIKSLETEPIQYIIKVGHGAHAASGVFILDDEQTEVMNTEYNYGQLCGENNESLIAQSYIGNPLLLDHHNKFDFRMYMLIASTNPLIVYYHDGYLRAALEPFYKDSHDRSTHLTNTAVAVDVIERAKTEKVFGMNSEELQDYHMWSMEKFQAFLLKSKKITDPNWLDNYLRPQFKKAMLHIAKMSSPFFWKGSNVYEIFGLDFMLDDNLNLWFIEGNPSPTLYAYTEWFGGFLRTMFEDIFDIEYKLYRSRMKRVLAVVQGMMQVENKIGSANYPLWRKRYQKAEMNRFEEEYMPRADNTFQLVMDESIAGPKAYAGNLKPECMLPRF